MTPSGPNTAASNKPIHMFFLAVPAGISQGFATVTLPYLLVHHGFSVAATGGIVAVGVSANLWRFVWGPVVDISLTLKKWYWISLIVSVATLLLLCQMPYTTRDQGALTAILFISQVAATFMLLPVTAFIAKSVPQNKKGSAAGWYQGGSLAGIGAGGGAGLWLANHYSITAAGFALCAMSVVFALVIVLMKDVPCDTKKTIAHEVVEMGKGIVAMVRVPLALFAIILICLPIGSGAAANLWSAIATDWNTDADTVALVTGVISGLVSTVGCIAGGYISDKWGVWTGYMVSGGVCALVALVMAVLPYHPAVFVTGVLAYTFGIGLINAAFAAVILAAIGKRHAATKYSLLVSLGNLPVVYMTAFNGWSHDHYDSKFMLLAEAALGILFIVICTIVLRQMRARNMLVRVPE